MLRSPHWEKKNNKYISKLFSPSKFDRDTEKPLFLEPQSLMHSSEFFLFFFLLPDTFSSSFNFLWQRKWVNVIPFLMGEQANLLTSSFVDWLNDGRETGDKRKVQKERFIWLSPLQAFLFSFSWETDYIYCWIILMSPVLHLSAFNLSPLSLHLLFPGSALILCSWKFLCLLQCSLFCFDALAFTGVQRRGTQPYQCVASLPGCGW